MIGLCTTAAKPTNKQEAYLTQYMDMTLNGKQVYAMVDMSTEANIMTKIVAASLWLDYSLSDTHLKTVNALPTPVCGFSHVMDITLGIWQGKTNFAIAP